MKRLFFIIIAALLVLSACSPGIVQPVPTPTTVPIAEEPTPSPTKATDAVITTTYTEGEPSTVKVSVPPRDNPTPNRYPVRELDPDRPTSFGLPIDLRYHYEGPSAIGEPYKEIVYFWGADERLILAFAYETAVASYDNKVHTWMRLKGRQDNFVTDFDKVNHMYFYNFNTYDEFIDMLLCVHHPTEGNVSYHLLLDKDAKEQKDAIQSAGSFKGTFICHDDVITLYDDESGASTNYTINDKERLIPKA